MMMDVNANANGEKTKRQVVWNRETRRFSMRELLYPR